MKIVTGSDGNLMQFRVFRILFPRLTMAELNATINKSIVLKTYNQSNIKKLSRCSVEKKHKDKCVRCRGDGPALPALELLGIIRVIFETVDNKTTNKKFGVQTRHVADSPKCKTNRDPHTKADVDNMTRYKTNIADYLNSSTSKTHVQDYFLSSHRKEADKKSVKNHK